MLFYACAGASALAEPAAQQLQQGSAVKITHTVTSYVWISLARMGIL